MTQLVLHKLSRVAGVIGHFYSFTVDIYNLLQPPIITVLIAYSSPVKRVDDFVEVVLTLSVILHASRIILAVCHRHQIPIRVIPISDQLTHRVFDRRNSTLCVPFKSYLLTSRTVNSRISVRQLVTIVISNREQITRNSVDFVNYAFLRC